MEEKTINSSDKQEILEAIGSLAVKVGSLDTKVGSLADSQASLAAKVDSLANSQDSLTAKVDSLATAQEETFREVMETMNSFATDTEERFERLEKDVGMIKATMVTRDYIDVSIGKSYGDAVAMVRKEDDKVDNFVGLLSNKQLITKPEAKKLVLMGPFPKAG